MEPLRKGLIAKMAYLAEFWLILERDLVESAPNREELCDVPHTIGNEMTRTIHLGYFP